MSNQHFSLSRGHWLLIAIGVAVAVWYGWSYPDSQQALGFVPEGGFDEAPIDYGNLYPEHEAIELPTIDLGNLESLPMEVDLGTLQSGEVVVLSGAIKHPWPLAEHCYVYLRGYPPTHPDYRVSWELAGLHNAPCTKEGDLLTYRLEAIVPRRITARPVEGTYRIEIEVKHVTLNTELTSQYDPARKAEYERGDLQYPGGTDWGQRTIAFTGTAVVVE